MVHFCEYFLKVKPKGAPENVGMGLVRLGNSLVQVSTGKVYVQGVSYGIDPHKPGSNLAERWGPTQEG